MNAGQTFAAAHELDERHPARIGDALIAGIV